MDTVAIRLAAVRARLATVCRAAGRDPAAVTLVAVSKFVPLPLVAEAVAAGQYILGESRIQDALPRQVALATMLREQGCDPRAIRWHFIGHLQSNKASKAAGAFALLHGVDSRDLAERLAQRAQTLGVVQPVLLEVNAAREPQKHGLVPEEVTALAAAVAALPNLDLRGLMAMARHGADEDETRVTFAAVRALRDAAAAACGHALPELSMGMSDDYPAAVAEGATLVRVGTAIFGPRTA